jgi:uncharacterized protein (DUF849 family)
LPEGTIYKQCAVGGKVQVPITTLAVLLVVSAGSLEDNIYFAKGVLAKSHRGKGVPRHPHIKDLVS